MYDLLIENARICDGTGAPSFPGCVAVKNGLIAAVGNHHGEAAAKTINADGLVLAPGFIDPHTHYDAQVAWDPLITCSSWHGITTVVMGNCGVGVAPVRPELRDILMWDLVNVEAIPFESSITISATKAGRWRVVTPAVQNSKPSARCYARPDAGRLNSRSRHRLLGIWRMRSMTS